MEPAPKPQQLTKKQKLEGAHLRLLHQRQNTKRMTQLFKVNQNMQKH